VKKVLNDSLKKSDEERENTDVELAICDQFNKLLLIRLDLIPKLSD
jgi:hypothetical protein